MDEERDTFLLDLVKELRTAWEGCAESLEEASEHGELKDRIDTLEQRLTRALMCIDDCREEVEALRKLQRQHMAQEQAEIVRRRKRWRRIGACLAAGVAIAVLIRPVSRLGWYALRWMGDMTGVSPELVAGVLAATAVLWSLMRIARAIGRVLFEVSADEEV